MCRYMYLHPPWLHMKINSVMLTVNYLWCCVFSHTKTWHSSPRSSWIKDGNAKSRSEVRSILNEEHRNNFFKSAWLSVSARELASWPAGLKINYNMCHGLRPPFPPLASPVHPLSDSLRTLYLCRPFTGCYNKFYEKGTYTCIVCDQELFSSDTKYDSGCGWPAFNEVLDQGRVKLTKDVSHGKRLPPWSALVSSRISRTSARVFS